MLTAASAIEETGLSPYGLITGDPVTALVAQINRFAGKTISPGPGCTFGSKRPLSTPLPLLPALDQRGADAAWLILMLRYSCAPPALRSPQKDAWVGQGSTNTWAWVMNNRDEITITLAQYGDSLGLGAASVGITTRDPRLVPKFPTTTFVLLGLGLGALASVVTPIIKKRLR